MASTFNDAVETRAFAALDAPQFAFLNGSAPSARSVATCVSAHKPLFGPNAAQFISINTTTDSNTTFIKRELDTAHHATEQHAVLAHARRVSLSHGRE